MSLVMGRDQAISQIRAMDKDQLIEWLLEGDVSIKYQAYRDLLGEERSDLRAKISTEGWGAEFLSRKNSHGHWGEKFYQPKWISSHYTLLDLKHLGIQPGNPAIDSTLDLIARNDMIFDPQPSGTVNLDVCVNGMYINYGSYFGMEVEKLKPNIDFILSQRMNDGGYNCMFNRSGARHSSLHSTLSIAEGIQEYIKQGYRYRSEELKESQRSCEEFILLHRLFLSDRTGKLINKEFLNLPFPSRWKYNILRALDYFCEAGARWDDRMLPAIDVIRTKRRKDGTWPVQAKHPGATHFDMEKAGKPSRWNTLRVLRVFKHFSLNLT